MAHALSPHKCIALPFVMHSVHVTQYHAENCVECMGNF